jgi:hypothetical protein
MLIVVLPFLVNILIAIGPIFCHPCYHQSHLLSNIKQRNGDNERQWLVLHLCQIDDVHCPVAPHLCAAAFTSPQLKVAVVANERGIGSDPTMTSSNNRASITPFLASSSSLTLFDPHPGQSARS